MTDPDNCGFCGKACPSYNSTDRKCITGKCSNACLPGYYDCNQNMADGCESTLSDNDNCGACGKSCGSSGFCVFSNCQYDTAGPLNDPRPGYCINTLLTPVAVRVKHILPAFSVLIHRGNTCSPESFWNLYILTCISVHC